VRNGAFATEKNFSGRVVPVSVRDDRATMRTMTNPAGNPVPNSPQSNTPWSPGPTQPPAGQGGQGGQSGQGGPWQQSAPARPNYPQQPYQQPGGYPGMQPAVGPQQQQPPQQQPQQPPQQPGARPVSRPARSGPPLGLIGNGLVALAGVVAIVSTFLNLLSFTQKVMGRVVNSEVDTPWSRTVITGATLPFGHVAHYGLPLTVTGALALLTAIALLLRLDRNRPWLTPFGPVAAGLVVATAWTVLIPVSAAVSESGQVTEGLRVDYSIQLAGWLILVAGVLALVGGVLGLLPGRSRGEADTSTPRFGLPALGGGSSGIPGVPNQAMARPQAPIAQPPTPQQQQNRPYGGPQQSAPGMSPVPPPAAAPQQSPQQQPAYGGSGMSALADDSPTTVAPGPAAAQARAQSQSPGAASTERPPYAAAVGEPDSSDATQVVSRLADQDPEPPTNPEHGKSDAE
jgi:hypothetical protein